MAQRTGHRRPLAAIRRAVDGSVDGRTRIAPVAPVAPVAPIATVAAVVAVVSLVALAGCSTLSPPSDPTTPHVAAVPDDPPPGVTRLGVVDADRLSNAHAAALRNETAYTLERQYTERYANGTVRVGLSETVAFDGRSGRFRYVQTLDGDADLFPGRSTERYAQWSNDSIMVESVTVRGADPTARVLTGTNGQPVVYDVSSVFDVSRSWELYTLFVVSNGTTVRRADGGYHVEAFDVNPRTAVAVAPRFGVGQRAAATTSQVSFEATVRPDGLVTRYVLQYVVAADGEPVYVTHRVTYTDLGSTTVGRPAWADATIADWQDSREPIDDESEAGTGEGTTDE